MFTVDAYKRKRIRTGEKINAYLRAIAGPFAVTAVAIN
jgi:hypothetical protein